MNSKFSVIGFLACLSASVFGASSFTEARGYAAAYNGVTDSGKYSAYVLDVSTMGLTAPASVSVVSTWLTDNWSGLGSSASATAMTYVDYDSVTGTHGFSLDGIALDGAGAQYYLAVLCSDGEVYGDVMTYSAATTGAGRLDFDIGGGSGRFAGNSTQSGWYQVSPEPTSGLLLLLGVGLVALKRRV